jgi:molybdate transport system ATP-binding protein
MTSRESVISVRFNGSLGKFDLNVSFEVPSRGITAIFGPSGSGKTTILRCISGLTRLPGYLAVGDQIWQSDSAFLPPHHRPIGYVFQEASLFSHLSVRNNLLYGRQRALKPGASEDIPFDDVIALMDLGRLLDRATTDLSGGERQRVAIGRALLSQPRLLLMDEPLAALDRRSKDEIMPFFEALHQTLSIPILYVSHDIFEVERLADTLVLLDRGRVMASGSAAEVLAEASLSIAGRPDAAVIVEGFVKAFDAQYGLTEMDLDRQTLLIPGRVGETGRARRVRIAAADISLAVERPSQTSILNVLPVRVKVIHSLDEATVNVGITIGHCDGGTKLLARISKRALETLGFVEGQDIYAQVKAVSLIV